jgi:hypothetical protein
MAKEDINSQILRQQSLFRSREAACLEDAELKRCIIEQSSEIPLLTETLAKEREDGKIKVRLSCSAIFLLLTIGPV